MCVASVCRMSQMCGQVVCACVSHGCCMCVVCHTHVLCRVATCAACVCCVHVCHMCVVCAVCVECVLIMCVLCLCVVCVGCMCRLCVHVCYTCIVCVACCVRMCVACAHMCCMCVRVLYVCTCMLRVEAALLTELQHTSGGSPGQAGGHVLVAAVTLGMSSCPAVGLLGSPCPPQQRALKARGLSQPAPAVSVPRTALPGGITGLVAQGRRRRESGKRLLGSRALQRGSSASSRPVAQASPPGPQGPPRPHPA